MNSEERLSSPSAPVAASSGPEERSGATPRQYDFRTYLVWLIGIALLPALLTAGLVLWQLWRLQDRRLDQSLEQTAQALSLALDREMSGYTRLLSGIAQSPDLHAGRLSAFHGFAREAAQQTGMLSIALFRPDGRQVLNTSVDFGAELPQPFLDAPTIAASASVPSADPSAVHAALAGKTGITNLFMSASLKTLIFTVGVPVRAEGRVGYALVAGLSPEAIARLLQSQFPNTTATIVDGHGRIVARSVDGLAATGEPARLLATFPEDQTAGLGRGPNREGRNLAFAFKRSSSTGWVAAAGLEMETHRAGTVTALVIGGAVFLLLLLLSVLAAAALARRVRRSVDGLVAVASGAPARGSLIREFSEVEKALSLVVTARKNEERERERRLLAELHHEEIARENRRKDLYLATLAHELRNPLASICNAVALLRRKGAPDRDLGWAREVIERQSSQMARLLDDLLDVSRIGQGKMHLQQKRVDIADVIRDALETSRPALETGVHDVRVDLPTRPVYVHGDRVRLAQVFSNLLTNAAKYTDAGGHIRISLSQTGNRAVVSVSDDGIGIEPDLLATVFEPFSQSSEAIKRAQGGLGIGLALVKGLVELHQGAVSVDSAGPGKGSRFTVSLPLSESREMDARPSREALPEAPLELRVLVVDDNRDAADSMAKLLKAAGADVGVTYDGASGLALARKMLPEVAILDVGMPGMNGYQLARALTTRSKRPYLIALTGWGQEADRNRAREAGFDLHLTKPVSPEQLFDTLRTVRNGALAGARIGTHTLSVASRPQTKR